MEKPLLETLNGITVKRQPIWFMRQAGRYLPEYRDIRSKAGSFLNLCYTPKWASEVTLQPLRRFDLDAAIIFSDILVIPHALGFSLDFKEGKGPLLETIDIKNYESLRKTVSLESFKEKLSSVYEAINLTKGSLNKNIALLGFCGAPWTLACYMVEGEGSKNFFKARKAAYLYPEKFKLFIDDLLFFIAEHLKEQIRSGADAVQVFDSWLGCLPFPNFEAFGIDPLLKLSRLFKEDFPSVPFIHFPRQAGINLDKFKNIKDIDAISIDETMDIRKAKAILSGKVLQGNLDPAVLASGGTSLEKAVENIMVALNNTRFIFNLGHGIDKSTDPENVNYLINLVRHYGQ